MFDRKHDQWDIEQAAAGEGSPDLHRTFDGILCLQHQRRRRLRRFGSLCAQGRPDRRRLVNELGQKLIRKWVEQDHPRHFALASTRKELD
jgi:hypothetical protein